jgi:hypothetical protein
MIAVLAALLFQAPPDDMKVDQAIRKGVAFLRSAKSPGVGFAKIEQTSELVLFTMLHAGVPPADPHVQMLLQEMLERPLERTYLVALQAMILEEVHRVRHQARLVQCAQFLVDNQCANGQWSYGEPSAHVQEVPSTAVASGTRRQAGLRGFGAETEKPKVTRRVPVRKMKEGPARGDNSNSQYAALGLRACADAGVVVPKEVLQLARKGWIEAQHPASSKDGAAVASGGAAAGPPRGWCYARADVCAKEHRPYGAMTAGGLGALAILNHLLEIDSKRDPALRSGIAWLAANWTVTEHPGPLEFDVAPKEELYYYLYALERMGMLLGIEKAGTHDWYAEGAAQILGAQKADGSWSDGEARRGNSTWDTCFAVLFLKRATRQLVASEDRSKR